MASKRSPVEELDQLDRRILSALSENGRLTTSALAEQVGLSTSPCWTRVKRLEETGAIEKYVAVLNHGNLGYNNVAFVEITLDKHDDKALERFGGALSRIPEVMEAYLVTGDYDYLIKVVNRYFKRQLTAQDVVYSFSGVRPLYDDNADNPSAVTRDYIFELDAPNGGAPLLSVFGGKITTFRKLSEHALEKIQPFFPTMKKAWTAKIPLPGGDLPNADFEQFLSDLHAEFSPLRPQLI